MQPKKLNAVGYAIKMGFDVSIYDLIINADSDNHHDNK